MNQLPRIDAKLLRQMQQIDADLEHEWRAYRQATRPSKLEVLGWSALGLLGLAATLYPIFKILEGLQ